MNKTNMNFKIFFIVSLLYFTNNAIAQKTVKDCACCSEEYEQFDFWLGKWAVTDTIGKVIGENLIEKKQDKCVLQENWKGGGSSTGTSYSYYNSADSSWNQVWIDNQGNPLVLKGKLVDDKMVLRSELVPGKKVERIYNRITWTPLKDGSVSQQWDVLSENDEVRSTVFLGIYRKRAAGMPMARPKN